VTARREFALLADQFFDLLPLLHSAQRQRKFGRMTAFQPNIAEIDAARLTANCALFDDRNGVAAFAQEIRRPGADEAAADNRNIGVDRAHDAVYHSGGKTRNLSAGQRDRHSR
jgi:hypothetical protein